MIARYGLELERAQAEFDLSRQPEFVREAFPDHYEGAVALHPPVSRWERFRTVLSSASKTILREQISKHIGEQTLTGGVSEDIRYDVFGLYRVGTEDRSTKAQDSVDNHVIEKIRKFVSSDKPHTEDEVRDAETALDVVTISAIYKTTQWGYLHNLVDLVDLQLAFVEHFPGTHPESADLLQRLMPLFKRNVLSRDDDWNMDRIEDHRKRITEISEKVGRLTEALTQGESGLENVASELPSSSEPLQGDTDEQTPAAQPLFPNHRRVTWIR